MNALQRDLKRLVPLVEGLGAAKAASDPHRQRYHIQPPVGWLNDPNGLCKVGDTYHVFYQYSPFNPAGGVKHWAHVTSTDLLHWQQQPVMLYPDEPFDCHGAYSGSALYEDGRLWLFYTGNIKLPGDYDHIRTGRENNLCLATSRDCLQIDTKERLMHNCDYPVGLSCHVRDPKVWTQDGRYYLVLGARTLEDRGEVVILQSEDRYHWQPCNILTTKEPFGYMWECPDLFQLDGQWYLPVSPQGIPCQNKYGCGYFPVEGDWKGACTLGEYRPMDYGFDYYAPQSFLDGQRRLQFGWMAMPDADYTCPTADYGWQNCLTVPRELTRDTDGALCQHPARELQTLRGAARTLEAGITVTADPCFELEAHPQGDFRMVFAGGLELCCNQCSVVLRFTDAVLGSGRDQRTLELDAPCRDVRVMGDCSSLEIFLNGGRYTMTTRYFPAPGPVALTLEGTSATLWPLG